MMLVVGPPRKTNEKSPEVTQCCEQKPKVGSGNLRDTDRLKILFKRAATETDEDDEIPDEDYAGKRAPSKCRL